MPSLLLTRMDNFEPGESELKMNVLCSVLGRLGGCAKEVFGDVKFTLFAVKGGTGGGGML